MSSFFAIATTHNLSMTLVCLANPYLDSSMALMAVDTLRCLFRASLAFVVLNLPFFLAL